MLYFNEFENLTYKFGDEVDTVIFQNLSIYVDIIDEIKNNQPIIKEWLEVS